MPTLFLSRGTCVAVIIVALFATMPMPVTASHSWGRYHWQRKSSAIRNIPARRYLSSVWLTRYSTALNDWRKPAMTKIKPYSAYLGRYTPSCPTFTGQISTCDGSYGNNGWLGLATIWISGSHIQRGTARMNNTYFKLRAYNTIPWRQLVMCQEIGHLFGLGHVNVVFNNPNVGSCMDYTNDPDGGPGGASATDKSNMHPYAHDYALINSKHNHIGFILPERAPAVVEPQAMREYNPAIADLGVMEWSSPDGGLARYEVDFGPDHKVVNWVMWAHRPR